MNPDRIQARFLFAAADTPEKEQQTDAAEQTGTKKIIERL
jgi:hypothetical protein